MTYTRLLIIPGTVASAEARSHKANGASCARDLSRPDTGPSIVWTITPPRTRQDGGVHVSGVWGTFACGHKAWHNGIRYNLPRAATLSPEQAAEMVAGLCAWCAGRATVARLVAEREARVAR